MNWCQFLFRNFAITSKYSFGHKYQFAQNLMCEREKKNSFFFCFIQANNFGIVWDSPEYSLKINCVEFIWKREIVVLLLELLIWLQAILTNVLCNGFHIAFSAIYVILWREKKIRKYFIRISIIVIKWIYSFEFQIEFLSNFTLKYQTSNMI